MEKREKKELKRQQLIVTNYTIEEKEKEEEATRITTTFLSFSVSLIAYETFENSVIPITFLLFVSRKEFVLKVSVTRDDISSIQNHLLSDNFPFCSSSFYSFGAEIYTFLLESFQMTSVAIQCQNL
uniref:Uncharacterized protein n=1 Tax=Caenorhabditis tropicalis TaxID=1561998 RepID=A0A1I7SZ65_9PELO